MEILHELPQFEEIIKNSDEEIHLKLICLSSLFHFVLPLVNLSLSNKTPNKIASNKFNI